MRGCLIVNGYALDVPNQLRQMVGFLDGIEIKIEKTVIICGGKLDGDDRQALTDMAPTKSVIFVVTEQYIPEVTLDYLGRELNQMDIYIFGYDYFGQEMAVRHSARLGGSSIVGATCMVEKGNRLYVDKTVYSGHMIGTFSMRTAPYCISIAKGLKEKTADTITEKIIEKYDLRKETALAYKQEIETLQENNGLENSKFVVIAGRGVGNKDNLQEVKHLSVHIGAEMGISRPVAMNAWEKMEKLVGVSGKMICPDVCITVGVSGAPALYAGIEKSSLVVAVNKDERAPIIKKANLVIIGDSLEFLQELDKCVNKYNQ